MKKIIQLPQKTQMSKRRYINNYSKIFILLGVFILLSASAAMAFKAWDDNSDYVLPVYGLKDGSGKVADKVSQANHLKTPEAVKAVYMTSCVAGTPSLRDRLVKLVEETELNSIMIDIKDYTGAISYEPANQDLMHMWEASKCGARDMKEFIASLHDKGIYVIGRVTVFQDPHLAQRQPEVAVKFASTGGIWRDRKGLNFTDPGAKEVWDYHIALAKDAYALGFDEINFDYIRFPSDGPMDDIAFPKSGNRPKPEVLESFFAYLHQELEPTGMVTSADLFGMTTTNTDDLNIGQVLERALPYFDYIAPMVYPSHYPPQFNGWPDPNAVPYELMHYVLESAVQRTIATSTVIATNGGRPIASTTPQLYTKPAFDKDKIRPWLQDFDYPVPYTVDMVKAQKRATYDVGLDSWMLWDPSNKYTREALENK